MKKAALAALMISAALSGCVSVLPEAQPAPVRYDVAAASYELAPSGPVVSWSLAVDDPSATRAYDTARIALTRAPGQIEYLAKGEWADRAPILIRTALIRSFENSGRILNVGDLTTLPGAGRLLKTDIRALQLRYNGGAPVAEVTIYAKLTNRRGKVLSAKLFSVQVDAASDKVADVGAAFDTAIAGEMAKIVDWTLSYKEPRGGQRNAKARPVRNP